MTALVIEDVRARHRSGCATTRLWVAPFIRISSRPRSSCNATEDTERTWPLPPHASRGSVETLTRWRECAGGDISRQAEARCADLDSRAVLPQTIAEFAFNRAVVRFSSCR